VTIPGQSPFGEPGPSPADDAVRWQEAGRLRAQFPGWIVIWLSHDQQFHAYRRMPGARRDTALTAATADDMAAKITQAEQPA
jgi:predicted ATPase